MKYDERYPYRVAKQADFLPASEERCPRCGSNNVGLEEDAMYGTPSEPDGLINPMTECKDCWYQGEESEFISEAPDADPDAELDFYPEWRGARRRARIAKDAAQLVQATKASGGGTFDPHSLEPVDMSSGYFVSRDGVGMEIPEEQFEEGIVSGWLANVKQAAGDFIGTWVDEGKVYLDLTRWFEDLDEALKFGKANNQIAVWDIENGEAVMVGVTTGKVASMDKTAEVQDYNLPPHGIHFRTHGAIAKAGLTATVTYPGGISPDFPDGLVSNVPGPSALDEMGFTMDAEMAGIDLESIVVQVESDNLPAVIAIFDDLGGRQAAAAPAAPTDEMGAEYVGRTAGDNEHTDYNIDSDERAVTCPKCGSHTLRAFNAQEGGVAELKCLTCGNEFTRPVMRNPESRVAAEGKFGPGTRITVEHPSHKGQRGSIVRFKGKHKDLDEEEYEVLLDSGDKLESLPESAFSKIKSAGVLPDTPADFFLGSMNVESVGWTEEPPSSPSGGFPGNMGDLNSMLPDVPDVPMDDFEEEQEYEVANCPACDGPGMLLGQLGNRLHYRCRNCGLDFSHAEENSAPPLLAKTKQYKDSTGEDLKPGGWYRMHHGDYTVPDVVKILNLEPRIEAEIQNGEESSFPLVIEAADEYSFEPYEKEAKVETAEPAKGGWQIVARKNWSASEQTALINENPDGRARNFDKLDLTGTHYEARHSADNDPDFLWGI